MNTPSPGLLRKALKIVDEIEKLDQQIYGLLSNLQVKEEALSHFSHAAPASKQKKKKVSQEKVMPPAVSEKKLDHSSASVVPQHEQQSFLIEDAEIEQPSVVESRSSEMHEELCEQHEQHSEQSCCLF